MHRLAPAMIAAAALLAALAPPRAAHGQTAWYEGFEGLETSWRDGGGNAQYRILQHQRVQGQAHSGDGCERLTVLGNHGTYVHILHDVDRPRIIDELLPTVWLRSDRAGLQMAARVVLPRTADPRTGRPVSTLISGSSYTNVGRWQQLRIADTPRLLARQIRALRSQLGPGVDGREAYIDSIVLNVYGGPGKTNVWIDDLDIAGFVASGDVSVAPPTGPPPPQANLPTGQPATRPTVELALSVLMVEGRPMFPRIIRHQGEPLALLKQLGFNAVWLARPASAEILEEAEKLDLWLICPPPYASSPYLPAEAAGPVEEVGPQYSRVLAWDLGSGLGQQELAATDARARQIRLADRGQSRPLICQPASELRAYSRHVDLLLVGRRPLGTSLELGDYANWVQRQTLVAPTTPVWSIVQTQPATALRQQLAALEPELPPPLCVSSEQIRLLAYAALSAGSRGLLFDSDSPLSASDPDTRRRAMTLELLNLELRLIEPWAAGGSFAATTTGSRTDLSGTLLRGNRSLLLLPMWSVPGAQFVVSQPTAGPVSLVVRGVPEDAKAYLLGPGALQPLWPTRVPGGTHVPLEELGLTGQVVFSQDPLAIDTLASSVAASGPRSAQLRRFLAAAKLQVVEQVTGQIATRGALAAQSAAWLDAARKSLQRCDGQLAGRDYAAACLHAQRAVQSLELLQRAHWQAAVNGLSSPLSSPGAVSFATLPWHWRLIERINRSRAGANLLPGGDFEDLPRMLAGGWGHFQHAAPGLQTAADLVSDAACSGNRGLRLTAAASDPQNPPLLVQSPPVWITSPPVPVEAGQLLCIHGWVQIPAAISGSVDGLLIIDSLTGEALAERIGQTAGWQEFTVYRAAAGSGTLTLTFALSGLGEARLDDVTIQLLQPAQGNLTQRPQPPAPLR